MLDERAILLARIQDFGRELGRAESLLNNKALDKRLRERVAVWFRTEVARAQADLDNVRQNVIANLPLDACWTSFDIARKSSENVFKEALAILQGALVRSAALDNRLCGIADALLDELSSRSATPWGKFTIMAEGDFFTGLADVIRLNFADMSLWTLPVAAHELGHFVLPRKSVSRLEGPTYPFGALLEREQNNRGDQAWRILHERLADLYAVWALGPAYACTCVLQRFDGRLAYRDTETHPAPARRVYWLLGALDRMDQAHDSFVPGYRGLTDKLRALWSSQLATVGEPGAFDQDTQARLDAELDDLYATMKTELPALRYDGWLRAVQMAQLVASDEPTLTLDAGIRLADVLNAAWLARLNHWDIDWYRLGTMERKVVTACEQIAARRKSAD